MQVKLILPLLFVDRLMNVNTNQKIKQAKSAKLLNFKKYSILFKKKLALLLYKVFMGLFML